MTQYSLTVIGTLRKNKPEVLPSFTKCASPGTLRFAYADGMTLVTYCPKNKTVLLLSTLHKAERLENEIQKPGIVIFYNKTKEGTLIRLTKCAKIILLYVLRIDDSLYAFFMECSIINAGINAAILYCFRSENEPFNRRDFLKQLAMGLI